jgi:hypothetical protein
MWQITWMLSFLPDWFWTLLLVAGVAAYGLSRFVAAYTVPMKIGGIIATVLGLWFLGAASNEAKWEARVKELEAKTAAAEIAAGKENIVVQEKVVKQKEYIKGKTEYITKYIDKIETKEIVKEIQGPERVRIEEVIKYIETCPVPKELVNIHDAAATLNKAAGDSKK